MSTRLLQPSSTVSIAGTHTIPIRGSVRLDETTTYSTARLTVPLLDVSEVEAVDPRDNVRALIHLTTEDFGLRDFDLSIRRRTVDHARRTVEITCASDEALLDDYAPLVDQQSPLSMTSLRTVVNWVLNRVIPGASLQPFPSDDALTTMLDVDNLVDNPKLEFDAAGWQAWLDGATGSGARIDATGPEGPNLFRASFTSLTSSSQAGPYYIVKSGVKPRTFYTASVWLRSSKFQNLRLRIEWKDRDGTTLSVSSGPARDVQAGVFERFLISSMMAPDDATQMVVTMYGSPTGGLWNNGDYLDAVGLRIGPTASEPLNWPVGTTAWDYLLNLTAAAHLRLFCDELRRWYLVPSDYVVEGVVSASPSTSKAGTDTIDRDGDAWADGVVARYRWPQADGSTLEKNDIAGSPGKVQIIEFNRPYPGPGAAAFRLNRLKGQGRVQQSVSFVDLTATPGMEARQLLPGTNEQIGRLQSVEFGLTDGYMIIGSRGLTDVSPDAFIYGADTITYDGIPEGMTFDTFDWSAI